MVCFSVNLDRNLYEGDIVLSKEQALGVSGTGSHPDGSTTGARTARAVVPHASEKWADGVVPYLFSPQLSKSGMPQGKIMQLSLYNVVKCNKGKWNGLQTE